MSMNSRNPVGATQPAVRVIVVAYGSGETLQACVDSICAQTMSNIEVRIVDNGPVGDRSVAALENLDDRFVVMRPGANLGFAGGNNLAAEGARTPWLALLNPDAIAEPDWLANLVSAAEAAGAKMAGSLQLWHGKAGRLDGAGDAYHVSGIAWRGLRGKSVDLSPDTGETFSPCAAAALYDRELFERVGGFDDSFFAYHEDVDLAFRMRLAGGRALQVKEARVWHVASGAPGSASDLAVRWGTRNRIWTFIKNMPSPAMWLLAPLHACAIVISLARDVRRGRGMAACRGISDAFRDVQRVWAERQSIQRSRVARGVDVLKAMTFSPIPLMQTGAVVRKWRKASLIDE